LIVEERKSGTKQTGVIGSGEANALFMTKKTKRVTFDFFPQHTKVGSKTNTAQ
jgi:hypothetical protein